METAGEEGPGQTKVEETILKGIQSVQRDRPLTAAARRKVASSFSELLPLVAPGWWSFLTDLDAVQL